MAQKPFSSEGTTLKSNICISHTTHTAKQGLNSLDNVDMITGGKGCLFVVMMDAKCAAAPNRRAVFIGSRTSQYSSQHVDDEGESQLFFVSSTGH